MDGICVTLGAIRVNKHVIAGLQSLSNGDVSPTGGELAMPRPFHLWESFVQILVLLLAIPFDSPEINMSVSRRHVRGVTKMLTKRR